MKKIIVTVVTFIISTILMINITIAATGTVTTDELNFRTEPNTDSESIQKLDKGTVINIVGEEGNWYKVSYSGKAGYVSKDYVTVDEENGDKSQAEVNENTQTNTTILIEDTSLYVLPLLSSSKIANITPNEKIQVLSKAGKWSYIQTDKYSGWIVSSKLTTINGDVSTNSEENVENTTNNKKQQEGQANENSEENNTEQNVTMVKYVNVYSVNIREKANTDSEILGSLDKNDSVDIISKNGDWYYVQLDNSKGYVKAEYLSDEKSAN